MTTVTTWQLGVGGALVAATLLAGACRRTEPDRVRVLCGSSMAAPMKEVAQQFTVQTGVPVEFDLGGSETLLPKILTGVPADIFVCHDPFEAKVKQAQRWANAVVVGHLEPVLAVRPGNPKRIDSIDNLMHPGLKIGIGDPWYSTCGELFTRALEQRGIRDKVMPQVVLQARSPSEAANGLIVGSLDVAVVWNFTTVLYTNRLEVVAAGIAYPDTRVTVIGLTASPHAQWRDSFLQWCARPETLQLFRQHGYARLSESATSTVP